MKTKINLYICFLTCIVPIYSMPLHNLGKRKRDNNNKQISTKKNKPSKLNLVNLIQHIPDVFAHELPCNLSICDTIQLLQNLFFVSKCTQHVSTNILNKIVNKVINDELENNTDSINTQMPKTIKLLFFAAEHGYPIVIRLIITSPHVSSKVVNAKNNLWSTPLLTAAAKGNTKTLKQFISSDKTDLKLIDGNTALMSAVRHGHIQTVKAILKSSKYTSDIVNAQDGYGRTALMFAAQKGNPQIVKILIAPEKDKESNVDCALADNQELTALQHAAVKGHTETVKVLMKKASLKEIYNAIACAFSHHHLTTAKALCSGRPKLLESYNKALLSPFW